MGNEVLFVRTEESRDLPPPKYQTEHSAGLDLQAAVPADAPVVLGAGKWALVPTGLRIALPPGFEAQVRARSGLALKHGIGILNGPGTIDADYRGEVGVILFNFSDKAFSIARGDRIAQIVINRVEQLVWESVEELPESVRGEGGFGHTGKN